MAAGNDIAIPPVPDKPYEIKLIPDKSKPIAVTGANGFLGTHICEMLLKKGYNIKAGVMGEDKHTRSLDPDNSRITFFSIDLLKPETFDPLFAGVEFVIHTAAPVNNRDFKDAWKDLVEPGIKGITNVLNSCEKNGVKKIVVTSSTGAVADDPSKLFDENDWNQKSNLNRLPYWYSKAKSESTAWEWLSKHPSIQMVVLNPGVFIGPYHATHTIPESNRQILDLVTADICVENRFMVKYCYCLTDVRDVAEAHVKLLENPNVFGRYLCCEGSNMWVEDCSKMIVGMFPSFSKKVAKKVVDSNIYRVKFGKSPTALAIILYLERTHDYNTRKIREGLGMEFIDIPTSIYDLVLDMVYKKHLKVQPEEYDDFVRLREKRLEEVQQHGPEYPYLGPGRDLYFPIPTQYYVCARKWKGKFPEFERKNNSGNNAEETNPDEEPQQEPESETAQESIPVPVSVPQPPPTTAPPVTAQPPPTLKKPTTVCWCW